MEVTSKYLNPLSYVTQTHNAAANKKSGGETKTDNQRNQEIANRAKEEARSQKSGSGHHWIV